MPIICMTTVTTITTTITTMLEYDFMRNAFAAAGVAAVVSGLVGYFLVLRGQTFAGHALGHIGFAGASGSILFGVGWGLVGLAPGPAIANLATLSTPVIVFVVAMVLGTLAHDLWYARGAAGSEPSLAPANADG